MRYLVIFSLFVSLLFWSCAKEYSREGILITVDSTDSISDSIPDNSIDSILKTDTITDSWSLYDNGKRRGGILTRAEIDAANGYDLINVEGATDSLVGGTPYGIQLTFIKPDLTKMPVTLSTNIVTATFSFSIVHGDSTFEANYDVKGSYFAFTIQNYDTTTNLFTATFAGTLVEKNSGVKKTVLLGIMKAKLD